MKKKDVKRFDGHLWSTYCMMLSKPSHQLCEVDIIVITIAT